MCIYYTVGITERFLIQKFWHFDFSIADLNTFLENASKTLEKSFENFRFSHLQTIILNGIVSVTKDFGDIAESANYLFNYEKFDKDSYDHDGNCDDSMVLFYVFP